MQYVRNIGNTAWTTWNSLNPATLTGAIDVIVVEHDDGTLVCSPFHVRFGKFSLLRPYEKKVEFRVNGAKQGYYMKLGEGGEAFFVFETTAAIPESMQTSPLVSPASSPPFEPQRPSSSPMQDPEPLDLESDLGKPRSNTTSRPPSTILHPTPSTPGNGLLTPFSTSRDGRPKSGDWPAVIRQHSDEVWSSSSPHEMSSHPQTPPGSVHSHSPPPLAPKEAVQRALTLSRELSAANIPSHVTETGDLKLDMTGYKSNDEDALRAEILARKILSEELDGNYDIGALFGVDEEGNLWIYSSEEAKDAAMKNMGANSSPLVTDAASDPGYQTDSSDATSTTRNASHRRSESDAGMDVQTPPSSPEAPQKPADSRSFAKTLRLTSGQLKSLKLSPGENSMAFTVNRSTCEAKMYLWKQSTPVVISDIDGTITKSDAMGHVMNMIGRDWTHAGVAKLYSDIATNGYNIMYLTSRSVGQSDSTRTYLYGIQQDGYKLPQGPTILSPDRTMAALRREIYLRKPHIFKMATLRDIRSLYGRESIPFYAGFGNRLTDQISYRTVDVPSHRIFTINSNGEVSLDLLSLSKLKLSYVNMTDIVDHYFPPVGSLITTKGGGDEFTDFKYWRDDPLALDQFSASASDEDSTSRRIVADEDDEESIYDGEEDIYDENSGMADSYMSRNSEDEDGDYNPSAERRQSNFLAMGVEDEYADDEEEEEEEQEEEDDGGKGEDEVAEHEVEDDQGNAEEDTNASKDRNGMVSTAAEPRNNRANENAEWTIPSTPEVPAEDLDAELITGVKNLTFEKRTHDVMDTHSHAEKSS